MAQRRKKSLAQGPETQADWAKGMVRDAPRTALPENSVYDAQDFLLHQPGLMQKRGGTSYTGPSLTAATYTHNLQYAEFPTGGKIVGIGDNGHLYTVTSGVTTDVATLGATFLPLDKPKLRVDKLILTANDGTTSPKYYDGAAVAAVAASAPAGKFAEIYKTRLVLGNTAANPNRLYFSPTPDITAAWDTTNSWIDCDYSISGLAATSNQLIIFSQGHTERIIGSTPPPGSDMDRTVIGSVGCTDARSICVQENNVLFANPRGIYLTNGSGFASLTTEGQIEAYWQGLFSGYSASSWTIAAGIFRSFYFVTIMNGSTHIDTLMCNVPRRAWWRMTNTKACAYATAVGISEELYYADRSAPKIVSMSGIFNPTASNKADADGTAVAPQAQLRITGQGPGLKHFGFGHITYDMRDAASDAPTLALSVAPGVEATTFTAVPESALLETTDADRKRYTIAKVSQGINVKLAQANASSKTEVYAVEAQTREFGQQAGGE